MLVVVVEKVVVVVIVLVVVVEVLELVLVLVGCDIRTEKRKSVLKSRAHLSKGAESPTAKKRKWKQTGHVIFKE